MNGEIANDPEFSRKQSIRFGNFFQMSYSIKSIGAAIQDFHKAMGIIYKEDANPFFKSKYASLATILREIKDPLQRAGLSFVQFPVAENEMTTMLMHGTSGEWLQGTFRMTPSKNDPQGQGSVITYQRRYALGAILGLNIDVDDDGNSASVNEIQVGPATRTTFPKKKVDVETTIVED